MRVVHMGLIKTKAANASATQMTTRSLTRIAVNTKSPKLAASQSQVAALDICEASSIWASLGLSPTRN